MHIIVLFVVITGSNIDCIDLSCTSCTTGFLYKDHSCLPQCPTGFTTSSSPDSCVATLSQELFSLKFSEFLEYGTSSIGDFSHPTNQPFSDASKLSPIPSQTSGFYFVSSSKLVSNQHWILGPDFTMKMWIRIQSDGVIFESISGGITYLQLSASSGDLIVNWYLTSVSTSAIQSASLVSYTLSSWNKYVVYSTQSDGVFSMTVNGITNSVNAFEYRGPLVDLDHYIGSSTGTTFTGFLGEMIALNAVDTEFYTNPPKSFCDYNYYYNNGCNSCGGCANTWPWCTMSSCSSCYSSTCSSCTGSAYSQCTTCNNGRTPPDCDIGKNCQTGGSTTFACNTCTGGYTNIDGLCLKSPYNYDINALSTPVIGITFDIFVEFYGGVFYAGGQSASYAPFNNPGSGDAYPYKQRGFYFNGVANYVRSAIAMALNYKTTVALWVSPVTDGVLFSSNTCTFYSGGYGFITLKSTEKTIKLITNTYPTYGEWVFYAYSIDFISSTTIITQTSDLTTAQVFSTDGYANYDQGVVIFLGRLYTSGTNFYEGFIYSLYIWQSAVTDLSLAYDNTCGAGLPEPCLWACYFDEYYNYYEQSCTNCEPSCGNGCSVWGTCEKCLYPDCAICGSYDTACTSTIANPCVSGLTFNSEKHCCDPACDDCFNKFWYSCLSCPVSFYLLGTICVSQCPLGYELSSVTCVEVSRPCIELTLEAFDDIVIDSISGIEFSTGTGTEFYPTGTSSDPIPSKQRGYYFTQTSYMTSEDLSLSYNFTMVFYIKHITPGILFTKSTLSFNTATMTFEIPSIITSVFSLALDTNWIILTLKLYTKPYGKIFSTLSYSDQTSIYEGGNQLFVDSDSALILGDYLDSFTGFLYKYIFYNSAEDVFGLTLTICTDVVIENCLWECGIESYFLEGTCELCDVTCTGGCRFIESCSLCKDPFCFICDDYDALCTECYLHYYWEDLVCQACETCEMLGSSGWTCVENSYGVITECRCEDGYYMDNNFCELCDSRCLTCFGGAFYQCLSCVEYLLEGLCLDPCPLGFSVIGHECIWENESYELLRYTFKTLKGLFYDDIRQVPAITGDNENYYPDLDKSDPVPMYERGIYFTGSGSYFAFPYPSTGIRLLGLRFSISAWINPSESYGTILSKPTQSQTLLFSVTINRSYLSIDLKLDNTFYISKSIYFLNQDQWSHILISIDYTSEVLISTITNTLSHKYSTQSHIPYIDSVGTSMHIGATSSNTDFYKGFMYSFAIYADIPIISNLISTSCENCQVCELSGNCIPNCNITTVYDNSTKTCIECLPECGNGCRAVTNCSLCADENCMNCENYLSEKCTKCEISYELIDSRCVKCNTTQYYNSLLKTCSDCTGLCVACSNAKYCAKCKENSSINSRHTCQCNQGYAGESFCTRNNFSAYITINSTNQASLIFEEPLSKNLSSKSIKVYINDAIQTFKITTTSQSIFIINIEFFNSISSEDILYITFTSQVTSIENSLLSTKVLTCALYSMPYDDIEARAEEFKNWAQLIMQVSISTILGISAINLNPSAFFQFLNILEIYSYAVLYNINIDLTLLAFLGELNPNSYAPDFFAMVVDQEEEQVIRGRFANNGCVTNLFFINSRISLVLLAGFLGIALVAFPFRFIRTKWVENTVKWIYTKLKFGIFLRLWIQSYFEVIYSISLVLLYFQHSNTTQILNISFTLLFLLLQMALMGFLPYLTLKKSKITSPAEFETFMQKYGTFYQEFIPGPLSSSLFYPLFILRRFVLILLIVCISDPRVQLTISFVFSLCIFFYLIATRSFKNGFAGYSIIANELIVVVYYSVISSKYILESRSTEAENALTCIYIVLLAVIVFILFNIAATLRNIYSWIQKRRAKPKVIPANITLEQSGDPNQSVKVPEFLDNE